MSPIERCMVALTATVITAAVLGAAYVADSTYDISKKVKTKIANRKHKKSKKLKLKEAK